MDGAARDRISLGRAVGRRRVSPDCLCECGGRTSWSPKGKENAVGREFDSDCKPDIRERPRTNNRGSSRIGTDDARRAGRAVPRRLQFTQQIVVLERRRREEDGVKRQPDECEAPTREIREYLQNPAIRLRAHSALRRDLAVARRRRKARTLRTMIQPKGTDELPRRSQHQVVDEELHHSFVADGAMACVGTDLQIEALARSLKRLNKLQRI